MTGLFPAAGVRPFACFVNRAKHPVAALPVEAFAPDKPSLVHVLVVLGSSSHGLPAETAAVIDQAPLGSIRSAVEAFLDTGQRANIFETRYRAFSVCPMAFGTTDVFLGFRGIAGFAMNAAGLTVTYYTDTQVWEVGVQIDPAHNRSTAKFRRQRELLKDIAAFDQPLAIRRILKAVETYLGLHLELELPDGTRQVMTFAPEPPGQ